MESYSQTDMRQCLKEVFCFTLSPIQQFTGEIVHDTAAEYGSSDNYAFASRFYTSVPNFV